MKKKLQFLFSLVAMMLMATFAKAQITIDTDLTNQFASLTEVSSWTGAQRYTATNFCPMVTVGGGIGQKQVCERYVETCDDTGDIFYATVTGLTAGTYTIELYGGAAYTYGRGFTSTAFSEGTWNAGDKIEPSTEAPTGVTLYATTSEGEYGGEIPIYYAQNFPDGAATITLSGVVVGTNGQVKIGMSKSSTSTNWHVIQLKSVIATVDAEALLQSLLQKAQAALDDAAYAAVTGTERTALATAISENASPEATAEAYQAAITAVQNATTAFTNALAGYNAYANAKAMVDLTAWPYASADKKAAVEALMGGATSADDGAALLKAYRQFVESNALAEGVTGAVDMTSLIVNPTAEEAIANPWTVVLGEGSGGALTILNNEPWTDGSDNDTHKYFDGGNWGATAWDVSLTQDITLEPGKYLLSAIGRASGDVVLTLFAGDAQATIPSIGAAGGIFNFGWNDQYVEFEVAEAGTVKIGVQGVTTKQYNWMSFSNFRLVQLEVPAVFDPSTAIVNAEFNPEADPLGWEKVNPVQYYDLGMGLIGTYQVRGEHPAATVDETHPATEYAAGLECRWQTNYAAFTQTTANLPAGYYKLTFDVENTNATTTSATYENRFTVTVGENVYTDESTEWMNGKSAWTTHSIAFPVEEAAPITISLGYGTGSNNYGVGNTPALFVSNLTLETISHLDFALPELQKAINAAQAQADTYTIGETLFTYAASEIAPLNDAIAAAQTAYTAAESAEAVETATETLSTFVSTFAPQITAPNPEKAYTIANTTATGNLSIETEAIKVKTDATVYFTAVEGGFVLSNENDEYIFKTTNNNWTLSTTTDIAEAYKVNINAVEGGFTIQGEKGLFGLDNADEGSAVYANKTAANNGVWTIAEYVEPGPEPVIADLTQAMFFDWDGVGAEAQKTSDTPTGCDYKLNTSTDMVYGTSTVTHTKYADLSEWDYLTIAAPQGTPRLQFNRKTADGQDHVKIPDNADDVEKYIKKSEDGTFIYDLAAIKAVWGFVHLNAIKTSGGPGIIQEMKLSTVKPYEPTWYTISVAEGIENGTVEATLTKSVAGAPVSVTATPAEGFELKAIKYTAEGEEPTTQEGTTFTMPAANVTVSATFTKAPEYIVSDLTKEMFHDWSAADGTAEITIEEAACDYAIGDVEAKAEGVALYGNGNVLGQSFADLSEYKSLALDVESGAIRIMLNTVGQENPKTFIELNQGSSKSYFSINNKTWTIDLDKFKQVENVEYVHLNVIKVAWGSSAAISAAKLTKLAEETPTLYTITIAETENGTVATDVEEAAEGATVTVTVTPNDGFMVDEVSLTYGEGQKVEFDGEPTENEGVLSATFTMPAGNVNVGFTFKKVEYDITVAGATPSEEPGAYLVEGGKICISSDAAEDEVVTLSLGPDEGYEVESVSVTKNSDNSEVTLIPDPEHQTNWTFIMPGEAVTVTAAFKKTSVEPTPTIAATLVHTASASWGANKTGDGNKPNTVDSEAEYYNNDATSTGDKNWNGAAYAEFETNLPNGVAITKATLTWQTVTAGRVNTERSNIVYYLNAGTQIDYEALAAYKEMTDVLLYEDARTQIKDYKGQNTFDGELDVTEAVQAIVAAKQNYIIFQWTGNNASATLAGKASANAPKLVIEYSDPEIEVDGIVYALKGENLFVNGSFDEGVAGWKTVGYTTDAVATNFTLSDEGGFDNGAFITTNGGGVGSENTIRQSVAVEPGKMYYFTVYTSGKAPDANNFNYNALFQMSDATTENGVLKAFEWPQGAAQTTTEWSQTEFVFTATEDNPFVGVRMGWNQNSSFDGFALYEVKQLSTALEAAQAKAITALNALAPVGDGIFMYAQTDIDAAKAAVAAATTVAEVEAVEMPTMTAPDANQQYILSLTTSEGTFPLSVATSGITIAEEGTPVTFVAQEGGTYAIYNGSEYVNYQGGDNWTMAATADAYGWAIATVDGGYTITGKNGFFGTNTSDGNAVNSPCYGDKKANNGNYIWGIAEYVEPTEKTIEIAFERMVNKGYTADEVSYTESEEEILEFLGVATWEDIETMYPVVMTTGVAGTDNDGWRDVNGDPAAWSGEGTGLGLCLKYPHDGSFALCTHPGNEPAEGAVLSAAWALGANGKTMTVKVNVTFIEYVEPEYKPEIAKTIEIEGIDLAGAAYAQNNLGEGMNRPAIKFDVNEICEALGVEDITTLKSYIVNVTTGNFVENTTDGWRNAQGDAAGWDIADNGYCLKMNAPASGEFDYAAAHDDNFAEGNTYVAQWGLVKESGEGATDQAVVLKVTITFVSEEEWNAAVDTATGIDGIASEGKAKANGKYLENGKVVIYRNGQKFSTTGVQLK